jgi:hypothetical protein
VGKSQIGRSTYRWKHNIKIDHKENGLESVVNDLAQNRDNWRALVIAAKTFRLRKTCGEMGIS